MDETLTDSPKSPDLGRAFVAQAAGRLLSDVARGNGGYATGAACGQSDLKIVENELHKWEVWKNRFDSFRSGALGRCAVQTVAPKFGSRADGKV